MSSKPSPLSMPTPFEILTRAAGTVSDRIARHRSVLVLCLAVGLGALALGGLRHQFSAGFKNFQGCAGDTVATGVPHDQAGMYTPA